VDNWSPILFGVVVVETGIRWHFGNRGAITFSATALYRGVSLFLGSIN